MCAEEWEQDEDEGVVKDFEYPDDYMPNNIVIYHYLSSAPLDKQPPTSFGVKNDQGKHFSFSFSNSTDVKFPSPSLSLPLLFASYNLLGKILISGFERMFIYEILISQ